LKNRKHFTACEACFIKKKTLFYKTLHRSNFGKKSSASDVQKFKVDKTILLTNSNIHTNNKEHEFLAWYSHLNSCSKNESLRSSQESSKAVRMGSLDDNAIKDGDANAR